DEALPLHGHGDVGGTGPALHALDEDHDVREVAGLAPSLVDELDPAVDGARGHGSGQGERHESQERRGTHRLTSGEPRKSSIAAPAASASESIIGRPVCPLPCWPCSWPPPSMAKPHCATPPPWPPSAPTRGARRAARQPPPTSPRSSATRASPRSGSRSSRARGFAGRT